MHAYLKSIGFSNVVSKKMEQPILKEVIEKYDNKYMVIYPIDGKFYEFTKYYSNNCGITVFTHFENDEFKIEYFYPFFRGSRPSSSANLTIEKYIDRDAFAGACDDLRVGVAMIFFLQNPLLFENKYLENEKLLNNNPSVILTALSTEGSILLPLEKDQEDELEEKKLSDKRYNLLQAAKTGDEDAIDSLTMDEMDTYSMISERLVKDDVLTIVDSSFIPYGLQSDIYKIIGNIISYTYDHNKLSNETLCQMRIQCSDIEFDICINRKDLLGEIEVGRRFKGIIWLQGQLIYK